MNAKKPGAGEISRLEGAIEAFDLLRRDFEDWLTEARDEEGREIMDNVIAHVEAELIEFRKRLEKLTKG